LAHPDARIEEGSGIHAQLFEDAVRLEEGQCLPIDLDPHSQVEAAAGALVLEAAGH